MAAMSPSRKRLAIAIIVVGGALIAERVYSLASAEVATSSPMESQRPARVVAADPGAESVSRPASELRLDRLEARQLALSERSDPLPSAPSGTPFDSISWQPPAPKPPPPPPPPKPVAPPFAYAYMGVLTEDGVRSAFFTRGERVIVVKEGDTIDATYHVDQMTSTTMKLTYLPLNETMAVTLGSGR
jgi:hypothetical protein